MDDAAILRALADAIHSEAGGLEGVSLADCRKAFRNGLVASGVLHSKSAPKEWSPEEESRLRHAWKNGVPIEAIALDLGRTVRSVDTRVAILRLRKQAVKEERGAATMAVV